MPSLAAHISGLEHRAEKFLLHIQVIGVDHSTLEVWINSLNRRACTGRQIEWIRQIHVARVIYRRRKRRIRTRSAHQIRYRLIVVHADAAANYRLPLLKWIVCESHARTKVAELAVIWPVIS